MNENGEKELILGNKQILSLFFVVVALCGVFFAMGYMVRGSALKSSGAQGGTEDASSAAAPTVKRQQPEPPRETAGAQPAASAPPVTASPSPETTPVVPQPYSEPKPFQSAGGASESMPLQSPESGATYVQVGALGRGDAESTVKTLREQHLPAILAPSSKEGLFRVLVGPYHQTSDVADTKARLKTLGFSDTIVQKQP
jgi:cell division septation protein DedD